MVLEIFFFMVRQNEHFHGLNIFGFEYKLSAYADDTTFFCSDKTTIINLKKNFDKFSIFSGLSLNNYKCEICGIGAKRGVNIALCGMKSVNLLEY